MSCSVSSARSISRTQRTATIRPPSSRSRNHPDNLDKAQSRPLRLGTVASEQLPIPSRWLPPLAGTHRMTGPTCRVWTLIPKTGPSPRKNSARNPCPRNRRSRYESRETYGIALNHVVQFSFAQYVPEDLKDEKYWARRRKNNMAAKRYQ